jgi:hypothetical protein
MLAVEGVNEARDRVDGLLTAVRAAPRAAGLSVDGDSLLAKVGLGAVAENSAVREYGGKTLARDFLPHKAEALMFASGIKRLADGGRLSPSSTAGRPDARFSFEAAARHPFIAGPSGGRHRGAHEP